MISFSLFSIRIRTSQGNTLTVSARDLAYDGFTFAAAFQDADVLKNERLSVSWTVRCLTFTAERTLSDFSLSEEERNDFFVLFRIVTGDPGAQQDLKLLMRELESYTVMKANGDDAALSAHYTAYPAEYEHSFPASFEAFCRTHLPDKADPDWKCCWDTVPSLALVLSFSAGFRDFLELDFSTFWKHLLSRLGSDGHPLASRLPDTLYIGSSWCSRLFPDRTTLRAILEKCGREKLHPVIVWAPLREEEAMDRQSLLQVLQRDPRLSEMLVNDIGMAALIREVCPARFEVNAGPLLNRRRKDPRLPWWQGQPEQLAVTSANAPAYRHWLRENGMAAVSWESCGYPIEIPSGDFLHLPFYQVGTGTHCPLHAVLATGKRGTVTDGPCSRECEQTCFLYGDRLMLTGRANSLFGLDAEVLRHSSVLRQLTNQGVRRIVLDLLQ